MPPFYQIIAVTRRLAVAWKHGKDALTQNRQLELEMSALLLMSRARLQAEIIVRVVCRGQRRWAVTRRTTEALHHRVFHPHRSRCAERRLRTAEIAAMLPMAPWMR